jgi:hypothetical protein
LGAPCLDGPLEFFRPQGARCSSGASETCRHWFGFGSCKAFTMLSESDEEDEPSTPFPQTGQTKLVIDAHWNIAEYLPVEPCQSLFNNLVAQWIYSMSENRMRSRKSRGGLGLTPIAAKDGQESENAPNTAHVSDFRTKFGTKLMEIVPKIERVRYPFVFGCSCLKIQPRDAAVHRGSSAAFPRS